MTALQFLLDSPLRIVYKCFMSTKALIAIRLDATLKRTLERAAKDDQRSLSAFLAILLAEWAKGLQAAKEQRR